MGMVRWSFRHVSSNNLQKCYPSSVRFWYIIAHHRGLNTKYTQHNNQLRWKSDQHGEIPGWGIYSTYIPQFILIWCCKNEGGLWRYRLWEVCYSISQTSILLPKADMVYMEVEVCLFQLISNDRGIKLTISSSITWYSHANLLTWNLYVLIPTYFLGFVPLLLNQHLSGYWHYGCWCTLTEQYQPKSS